MPVDLSVFDKLKTFADYQRAEEEFQLQKQLASQKLMQAQRGADLPSPIQVANEIDRLWKAGDYKRANLLLATSKVYDKGLQMGEGGVAQIPGYTDALSGQRSAVKGAEQQAVEQMKTAYEPTRTRMNEDQRNQSELNYKPSIEANTTAARIGSDLRTRANVGAQLDLPKIEDQSQYAIQLLDNLASHPGLSDVVGVRSIKGGALGLPIVRGTSAAGFKELLDQVQGKQFLEAFESLKGAGQITEVEGQKATAAIARLGTAQSEIEFKKGLKEFQDIIKVGLKRARSKAQSPTVPQASNNPWQRAYQEEYSPADGVIDYREYFK